MLEIDIEDLMQYIKEDITIFIPVIPNGGSDEYGDSSTTFTQIESDAYFAVNKLVRLTQLNNGAEVETECHYIYIPQDIYTQNRSAWTRGAYIIRDIDKKRHDIIDVDVSNSGLSRVVLIGTYNGADDNYDTV